MTATTSGRLPNRLISHYAEMSRIRAFEEKAIRALQEGHYTGFIHPSIGQEAVPVGVCANLNKNDILLSTHRGHGHTMAKGASAAAMMCELFGRLGGVCGGKGGSMHIADFEVGMLGANGVVGANILIATGAAHAIRLRGEERIVTCFFGDGAINRGPFLEGLNWARVFNLPVLFVCEDNGFAATTRTGVLTAGDGPAARARSLDIAALEVDGNDVAAVDAAARDMTDAIRQGQGPRLIVARTYRLTGHTSSDPASYRDQHEVDEQWRHDPLERCAAVLREAGVAEQQMQDARSAAREEMQKAFEIALAAPWPDIAETYTDVQDVGAFAQGPGR